MASKKGENSMNRNKKITRKFTRKNYRRNSTKISNAYLKETILKIALIVVITFFIASSVNLMQLYSEYVPSVENYQVVMEEQEKIEVNETELEPLQRHSIVNTNMEETINFFPKMEEDLILLAAIITKEAGICDKEEQLRVGNVVLNRVEDNSFPNSIEEVIFQKGQYEPAYLLREELEYTEMAYEVAYELLYEDVRVLPSEVVFQSLEKLGKVYYKSKWGHYFCSKS